MAATTLFWHHLGPCSFVNRELHLKPHKISELRSPSERFPGVETADGAADSSAATWAEETIVAVSTATGPGAIGIVRLSGPGAVAIAQSGFVPARGVGPRPGETYSMLYGHVVDPHTGQSVDEALLALMRAPRSYTREDVVELHCHGGLAAQLAVLRLMIRLGARLAEPGEFTRRAFLNGRIDLAQAESVAAIGQGANDAAMLKEAALGICVMSPEGAATETLLSSDLVMPNITAALELLDRPLRIVASLRK